MGLHNILVDLTTNEGIDLGKGFGEGYQMPPEAIVKFLRSREDHKFWLTHENLTEVPEVDCWSNYTSNRICPDCGGINDQPFPHDCLA